MKPLSGPNPFKVGDILHHQFHYTASFPQFFKVLKVTPKTVVVTRLSKHMVSNLDGYGQHGTEAPDEYGHVGKEFRAKVGTNYTGAPGVLVDAYMGEVATLWDGQPKEYYGD